MIYPSIGSLLEKVENSFALAIVTAKRARQLIDGAHKVTTYDSVKPVSIAIMEVYEDKITYVKTKSGIK